jgi:hypothetical protein
MDIPTEIGAPLAVLVVLTGVAWFAVRSHWDEIRRRRWEAFARKHGMFLGDEPWTQVLGQPPYEIMSRGWGHFILTRVLGNYRGHEVRCFDYMFEQGTGRTSPTRRITLVAIRVDVELPHLVIRPERARDRLREAFGQGDLDFESEAFSRAYYVQADTPRQAYDVLHPKAVEYLLNQPEPLVIEGSEGEMVFARPRVKPLRLPGEVEELLAAAIGFVDLLPDYLR